VLPSLVRLCFLLGLFWCNIFVTDGYIGPCRVSSRYLLLASPIQKPAERPSSALSCGEPTARGSWFSTGVVPVIVEICHRFRKFFGFGVDSQLFRQIGPTRSPLRSTSRIASTDHQAFRVLFHISFHSPASAHSLMTPPFGKKTEQCHE